MNLLESLSSLEDPRSYRNQSHDFVEILVIAVLGIICGAKTWGEIEMFGEMRESWLRERLGLKLENGVPSLHTFNRVISSLKAEDLRSCFISWVKSISKLSKGEIVAIDGKTLRNSHEYSTGKSPLHMLNAIATDSGLSIGQLATGEKSNEITAIPKLLEMLEIKGCIVTIDAMGCQKVIVKNIVKAKADYVLALKWSPLDKMNQVF